MSMNLHLQAEREVTVKKTGKASRQTVEFDLWQTPTVVTEQAMGSGNPKEVYTDWVKSVSKDEQIPMYTGVSILGEGRSIGFTTYNAGKQHLEELENFLLTCEEEGYEIEFFEM